MQPFDSGVFFALASGILSALAFLPYLLGVLRGRCRPLRSAWLIWSALSIISLCAMLGKGTSQDLVFVGVQAGCTTLITLLAVRHGMGSLLCRGELPVLLAAALGLFLWWHTQHPGWALGICIGVSALGGAVAVRKAFRAPETEAAGFWAMSALAGIFGTASVAEGDPFLLAYPLYIATISTSLLLAVLFGRLRHRNTPHVTATLHRTTALAPGEQAY